MGLKIHRYADYYRGTCSCCIQLSKTNFNDPVLEMLYLIIRDEARHVTFGVNYLEEYLKNLSQEELEEELCLLMKHASL